MNFIAGVCRAGMSANFLQADRAYSSDANASGVPIRWTFTTIPVLLLTQFRLFDGVLRVDLQ